MRTDIRNACAVLAALALSGCFADVEDKSVVYKQSLPMCGDGTTNCEFPPDLLPGPFKDVSGSTKYTLDLGGSDLLTPKKDVGPATLTNTLTVNNAKLVLTTAGADFSGISTLKFLQLAPGTQSCDATCPAATCREIATYDQTRDGAMGDTIVLRGSTVNLLDFSQQGQITLCVAFQGAPPSVAWTADAFLDLAINAHAGM